MESQSYFDIPFKEIASQGKLIGFIREAAGFLGLLHGRIGTTGNLRSSLFHFFSLIILQLIFVYVHISYERGCKPP